MQEQMIPASSADFETSRTKIGWLASELMSLRDRLDSEARRIDTSGELVLPSLYRGTVEAVARDLLDDAVETLVALGVMREEDAREREAEAVRLLDRLNQAG